MARRTLASTHITVSSRQAMRVVASGPISRVVAVDLLWLTVDRSG
jgi:hypothetical protein